jgi:hypothetical protein
MSKDVLRYDLMVQEALKGVVRKILTEAGRDGLPGDHHFYVTFRTTAPGVRVSTRLREKHPDEMTIVLQHQFWDLSVSEHAFEVGLSFSGVPERLLIPFDAITTFFDPSVQFGLKFETQEAADSASANDQIPTPKIRGAGSEPSEAPPAPIALPVKATPAGVPAIKGKAERDAGPAGKGSAKAAKSRPDDSSPDESDAAAGDDGGGAQVVSLDSFRKKT